MLGLISIDDTLCRPNTWLYELDADVFRLGRQKPKHYHAATDPLVNPGNPPHCHQTRSKAYTTRTHHRMVLLA